MNFNNNNNNNSDDEKFKIIDINGDETSNNELEVEEEENLEPEDEYKGIEELSKEELIATIKEIREEYYKLKTDYNGLEVKLQEKCKEIEFNRQLLTEREDLLLQLQWDPQQDQQYLFQMGASDTNQANELKMKALLDQLRLMEKGIFERDDKIAQMEKVIEQFTLQQISNGLPAPNIQFAPTTTIQPKPSTFNLAQLQNSLPQQSPNQDNNLFKKISEHPITSLKSSNDSINILTPNLQNPNQLNRSPSFWQSPSNFFSYWLGLSNSNDENSINNSTTSSSSSSSNQNNISMNNLSNINHNNNNNVTLPSNISNLPNSNPNITSIKA
eukprot:gene7908-9733_t